MNKSYFVLLLSTLSIGFLHALTPDHWMPLAVIGKAKKWPRPKLMMVTFISGLGHVGSSILLGCIGMLLGFSLSHLKAAEAHRAEIGLWLLIGFGVAYAVWGLKKARDYKHEHIDTKDIDRKTITMWTLFAVFVLGPCEPLIPLMFLATGYGWIGILMTSLVFSVVTIFMMLTQTLLAYYGIQLIRHDIAGRYSHAFAGFVIALTGVFIMVIG
jgi:ABC-type nickel/cobalt efflux system permease component RcnA